MSACPECRYFGSQVRMTRRLRNGWVKRWRCCQRDDCSHKWVTFEIPAETLQTDAAPEDLREIKA